MEEGELGGYWGDIANRGKNGVAEGRRAPCVEVPEPSTYLLMLTGLLGLGFVAWRRKEEILA